MFMCLVGPSGSGKTQFLYDMFENKTFEPMYDSIVVFIKKINQYMMKLEKLFPALNSYRE